MTILDIRVGISRLNNGIRLSLERAVGVSVARSHASVEVEHWLAELARPEGPAEPALRALDVSVDRLRGELSARLDRTRGGNASAPALSPTLLDWLQSAWLVASLRFGRNEIAIEDLLAALATSPVLRYHVRDIAPSLQIDEGRALALAGSVKVESSGGTSSDLAAQSSADGAELDRYTLDLTARARAGQLDPVVGREAELRQIIDILMRRRQNNPILTGEAGVGKTAVVEALALRIAEGKVPEKLKSVVLRSLDLGLLQAGAGVKGEFERRLTGVIAEIKASSHPIILFIDEAHVMIGAGNQAGGSDAANLLKPALARGELRTIAATTWSEYKRHIERDPALTRRFQVVKIDEPTQETAVRMLRGIVPQLETHHGVRIKDEALAEAVTLTARYLPDRQLPDKAISVLDTAAAGVAISHSGVPAAIEDLVAERAYLESERAALSCDAPPDLDRLLAALDERIADVTARHEGLRARFDEERALFADLANLGSEGLPDRRLALERQLASVQGDAPLIHREVGRDAIASVVARWTGVPVGRLVRDSIQTAMTLAARMRERVVRQDRALDVISAVMRSSAARLADPRKPPGVFLMVGPSGVGKTETALALADLLYGGKQHLTVLNMSEFKEEHKVSTLVGSPPGYVGYGDGGVLTEAVRRRPYGLLLLDEMEKAHPGVQDVFYQVFDKGVLRDSEGRDVEFRNTTVIMTSNAGAETLAALAADPDTCPEGDALIAMLQPELSKWFKPAFLGRVMIVPYMPLSETTLLEVARLQISRIRDQLAATHKIHLDVDTDVETEIVGRCLSGEIGARAIESVLSRELLPRLSDAILDYALRGQALLSLGVGLGRDKRFEISAVEAIVHRAPEQPESHLTGCSHACDDASQEPDLAHA
jgi:type VI secretion system protein VasG